MRLPDDDPFRYIAEEERARSGIEEHAFAMLQKASEHRRLHPDDPLAGLIAEYGTTPYSMLRANEPPGAAPSPVEAALVAAVGVRRFCNPEQQALFDRKMREGETLPILYVTPNGAQLAFPEYLPD